MAAFKPLSGSGPVPVLRLVASPEQAAVRSTSSHCCSPRWSAAPRASIPGGLQRHGSASPPRIVSRHSDLCGMHISLARRKCICFQVYVLDNNGDLNSRSTTTHWSRSTNSHDRFPKVNSIRSIFIRTTRSSPPVPRYRYGACSDCEDLERVRTNSAARAPCRLLQRPAAVEISALLEMRTLRMSRFVEAAGLFRTDA